MSIDPKLLDQLIEQGEQPEDLLGKSGLVKEWTSRRVERAVEAGLIDHLGYDKHAIEAHRSGNTHNGHGKNTRAADDRSTSPARPP